jgi:hypothetical protein
MYSTDAIYTERSYAVNTGRSYAVNNGSVVGLMHAINTGTLYAVNTLEWRMQHWRSYGKEHTYINVNQSIIRTQYQRQVCRTTCEGVKPYVLALGYQSVKVAS